ncbi:MAG TPA: ABC transporter permease [Frankiaceae bacterium]|jgi:ABC-2 type transport system permease protein|nr:ABC transporter permease [Frankiaceae bacterium]
MSEPGDGIDLDARQAVSLVATREIITRGRSKVFRITTIILLVGIIATVAITKAAGGSKSVARVGFLPSQQAIEAPFKSVAAAVGQDVDTFTVNSKADGESRLRAGKLAAVVTGSSSGVQVEVKKDLSDTLRSAFTVLARSTALDEKLQQLGVDPVKVSSAVAAANVDVHSLTPPDPHRSQRLAVGVIAGILVYVALMLYGQMVAQGVVEEKTSRIVELLLTAIRPWQLLLGKVLGIGVLGLGQLLLVAIAGVVTGVQTHALTLPGSVAASALAGAVVWFLLGYLAYALMFAAVGALVSRQEDVGGAVAPLTVFIVVPYVLGVSILPSNPGSLLLAVLSFIPLFSPTLMPMRIAAGVPLWETLVSVGVMLAFIASLVWIAGRIYGNAVTRTGARVKIADALKPI